MNKKKKKQIFEMNSLHKIHKNHIAQVHSKEHAYFMNLIGLFCKK